MVFQNSFVVPSTGRGLSSITSQVAQAVADANVSSGLATVFVHHTSASLLINENADPKVCRDLDAFFTRLVPDGDAIYTHVDEGPDDMSAHVRSVLTATSLNIPVAQGRLDLGTWQGIYLFEHRASPHQRRISVTVLG